MKVHIITATTLKGRANEGRGGYILALDNDGEINDQNTRKRVIKISGHTRAGAEVLLLAEAVGRITRPVDLHIWTNNGLIYGALANGWAKGWARNGYRSGRGEPIKNATAWQQLINNINAAGINIDGITCHHNEQNPYSKYLQWEITREG